MRNQREVMNTTFTSEHIKDLVVNAKRLTSLISNLQFAILLENEKREIVLVNQRFCDLFEIPAAPEMLVGVDCTMAAEQSKHQFKDPEQFVEQINLLLKKKEKLLHERLEKKDGTILLRDFIPVWNDDQYQGHLWVYNDITEKTRSDELLKNQREFFEEILNQLPADVAVFSRNHEYLFVNPKGIKDPELRKWIIGKKDEDYCLLKNKPFSLVEGRRKLFNNVVESKEQKEWIEQLITPDGKEEYHLRKMYPVLDESNEVKILIGYGVNVTQQKDSERRIRVNEKRYRDLFNYSPALIFTHDTEGTITSVNNTVQGLLGYTLEEVNSRHISSFLEEGINIYKSYLERIGTAKNMNGVLPVISKSGTVVHLLCHAFRVEEDQQTPYIIVFAQDITVRILAEEKLLQAKKLTEEAAATKSTFMAKVSHEIRTPMNGILGIADLLSKTALTEQQLKYTNVILESSKNLLAVINNVLDIEKIVSGKMLLQQTSFNFSERLAAITEPYHIQAKEKNICFAIKNNIPEAVFFTGDPFKIAQVLNNLLSNAIKFTYEGSIVLETSATTQNGSLAGVCIKVTDTGIGIPVNKLQEIFDPFSQAHFFADSAQKGTGLGLTVCKELVELMNGKISVSSTQNKGTEFLVELPLSTAAAIPQQHIPNMHNTQLLAGKNILLAEDHSLNQFLVQEIASKWKVNLDVAENGSLAVAMAREKAYDLILMDIQMPVMNGLEACLVIRAFADPAKRNVPIVALTASSFIKDAEKYRAAGMNDLLAKPFDERILFETIQRNLNSTTADPLPEKKITIPTPSIDLSYLKRIAGPDNPSFLANIIDSFKESTAAQEAELEQCLKEKTYDQLSAIAHKFKFSVNTLGINSLKEEILWLEKTAAEKNFSPELISRFEILLVHMKNLQSITPE